MMINETCASCIHAEKPSSDVPCDDCDDYGNWEHRKERGCDTCRHNTGRGFCFMSCMGGKAWVPCVDGGAV